MKELKNISREKEKLAYENVEGFDLTELCYKTIFNILNDADIFVKVFSGLTTYQIEDKSQVGLQTFKYGFIKEKDGKIYPTVDLIIWLRDKVSPFQTDFCLTLTPFNAGLDNVTKNAGVYGYYDKELTKVWRVVMSGFFGKMWKEAFKRYCDEVKNLKESKVATKAEIEYQRIEQEYEDEINLI